MRLNGARALVTGSSRGIGRAIAKNFATHGARVAIHYTRDRAAAEQTLGMLSGSGHAVIQADLAVAGHARHLVERSIDELGGLQIAVNNAGIYRLHPPGTTPHQQWEEAWATTLGVNLLGAAHVSYWAAREMTAQGGGRIINISSRGAFRGEPDAPAYGASKAGMNAMSQSMAKALAGHGVLVFAIAPGWVATDMATPYVQGEEGDEVRRQSPLNRVATPEEIAEVALFLASSAPATMTGAIIDVNGASYLRT